MGRVGHSRGLRADVTWPLDGLPRYKVGACGYTVLDRAICHREVARILNESVRDEKGQWVHQRHLTPAEARAKAEKRCGELNAEAS